MMRKAWTLLIIGIWVVALPYLGFPYSWKEVLTNLTGLVIICFSFLVYKDYKNNENQEETFDNYSENADFGKNKNINDKIASGE